MKHDIIIVGAGAAGMMAAHELSVAGKSVLVLEARDRIGGRIYTVTQDALAQQIEAGAEFVHGNLPVTIQLLKEAGIKYVPVAGEMWQYHHGQIKEQDDFIEDDSLLEKKFKELKTDISVAAFMDQHLQGEKFEELRFTLKNYVEGYYAADIHRASTLALKDELQNASEKQYRIKGGYQKLIDHLQNKCSHDKVQIVTASPVQIIEWQNDHVIVTCGALQYTSSIILITVPVGVMQNESIEFKPAIPEHIGAFKQLGYGPVIKMILQFRSDFWKTAHGKNLSKMLFLFSNEQIPTWWTAIPEHQFQLTGWLGGPPAADMSKKSEQEILQAALESLSVIFNRTVEELLSLLQHHHFTNWQADRYSAGAYSYDVVGGEKVKDFICTPIHNTLFFAGEGLHHGPEIGTVEAALQNGKQAAQKIITASLS